MWKNSHRMARSCASCFTFRGPFPPPPCPCSPRLPPLILRVPLESPCLDWSSGPARSSRLCFSGCGLHGVISGATSTGPHRDPPDIVTLGAPWDLSDRLMSLQRAVSLLAACPSRRPFSGVGPLVHPGVIPLSSRTLEAHKVSGTMPLRPNIVSPQPRWHEDLTCTLPPLNPLISVRCSSHDPGLSGETHPAGSSEREEASGARAEGLAALGGDEPGAVVAARGSGWAQVQARHPAPDSRAGDLSGRVTLPWDARRLGRW